MDSQNKQPSVSDADYITKVKLIYVLLLVYSKTKDVFTSGCLEKGRNDCQKLWIHFMNAFKGNNLDDDPIKAFSELIEAAPFEPLCGAKMPVFWSGTKDVVHYFTDLKDSFVDSTFNVLGHIANLLIDLICNGTCTTASLCENHPVRSLVNAVSAAYAEAVSGDIMIVLDGSKPVDPKSTFATIEMPRLIENKKVKRLIVVLSTDKSHSTDPYLKKIEEMVNDWNKKNEEKKEIIYEYNEFEVNSWRPENTDPSTTSATAIDLSTIPASLSDLCIIFILLALVFSLYLLVSLYSIASAQHKRKDRRKKTGEKVIIKGDTSDVG